MRNLIYILLTSLIISCGSSNPGTPIDTVGDSTGTTGCPAGRWYDTNGYGELTIGQTGLITIRNNLCTISGRVSCRGLDATLTVESYTEGLSEDTEREQCQAIGVWQCEYDNASSNFFNVYCSGAGVGNIFSPARTYKVY